MEMAVAEEWFSSSPGRREWVRGNVVGVGAFGTVSLAMNKANGELFAVKSIECRDQARRGLLALENETRILQELDSPWIVTCLGHDCTEENGIRMWNLFMEYMAGGSVADILKKFGGKLDESVIRTYTRDILQGIHYLHRKGIVHCDIKGKNVLLGSSGVKIADFGSAKRMGRNGENELVVGDLDPRQLRGTPLWMAPEVVKQEEQGPASDIWSLGCTVIEMASGRSPWSDIAHPLAALYRIGCTDEIPELPQCLSPEGLDFLEKCFRRDPKQRWTSAQLLNHPFLNECCPFQGNREPKELRSPISVLGFHLSETQWDSDSCTLSQTVPILALRQGLTPSEQTEECRDKEMRPNGKILSPSPTHRMLDFAENLKENGVRESTAAVDGIFESSPLNPPGQWIVVRSPKGMPPRLDGPFTDFIDGSSTGKLSPFNSPKVESSTQLESGDCEDAEPRREPLKSETYVVDQIREFNHGPSQSSVYGDSLTIIDNLVQAGLCNRELIFQGPSQNCKYSSNLFVCSGESRWESWIINLLEFECRMPLLCPIFSCQNKEKSVLACGIQREGISSLQLIQQTMFCQNCFKPMPEVTDLRQGYYGIASIATDWCSSKDPVLDCQLGASCCSCSIICRTKYYCNCRMMGILYVDGGADERLCNFIQVIISVQFTWLHFWLPAPLGWGKLAFLFHLVTFGIIFSFIFIHFATETSKFETGQETAKTMDFLWPFQ